MTRAISYISTTQFKRLIKSVCFSLFIMLTLSYCANENGPQKNNELQKIAEKPLKYIAFLAPGQEANGVLVKFSASTNGKNRARSLQSAGLVSDQEFKLVPGLTLAQPTPGLTINETLTNLKADPNVAYAEPDYIFSINAIPDDIEFATQWGLDNADDTDIDAPEAWDIGTGNNTIIVAVIDSGVDYTHPDLADHIWSNPGEIPNNGVDDDNNGYIDDIRGWDFYIDSNDNDPMDEHMHGTHVAGIIGAQTNNALGVAGINWNIQIMPLKFMSPQGSGASSAAIKAIEYAVANGALISNNSWGGDGFSQSLYDAIQAANQQGHLFITAAGNGKTVGSTKVGYDTDTTPQYPSAYDLPNIISVAASNQQDQLTVFSNFGVKSVDLAAPGFRIQSTVLNGEYRLLSGTSMATPFVTGVAALLLAQNDTLTASELKAAILDNVDPIPSLTDKLLSGGRLNAFNAITGIASTAPLPTTPVIDPVEITPPTTTALAIGDNLQLNATGGDNTYTWSSLTSNATIDSTGLVTAVSSGTALITVTDGTGLVSPSIELNINGPTAVTLLFNPVDLTQIDLNAVTPIAISGGTAPYIWRSSDITIANLAALTDSRQAEIVADSIGTFSITVTDANDASATSALITVNDPALSIIVDKSTISMGETLQLTASGGTSPYTWDSSDPIVVTIDSGGLATSQSTGSSILTVTDMMGVSKSVGLQIVETVVNGLTITPANSVLIVNSRARLKATGGGLEFTWSSSDPVIVSIDDRGIITANAEGVVQISVLDENGTTGMTDIVIRSIKIVATTLTINVGDTLQLTAEGGQEPYTWKASNTDIVTIDDTGLLTSSADGSSGGVLISVTDADDISKSTTVTVN